MMQKIDEAEATTKEIEGVVAEGVEPYTTLQALRKALPTDAWRPLLE